MIRDYIRLVRPKHALKNIYVFFPLVFGHRLTDLPLLGRVTAGFFAFCAAAFLVYVMNDLRDAEKDRRHPAKKQRPIASGAVSERGAVCAMVVLAAVLVLIGFLSHFDWKCWLCVGAYLAVNVGYSFGMKEIPILDVAILTLGFLLRVLFGSAVSGIAVSGWLYLTVMAVSFYLAMGKRRNELRRHSTDGRAVLERYSDAFLEKNMQICLTLGIAFYALWSMQVKTALGSGAMVWTVPLVLCICMKYSLTIEGESDGDPVEVLYADKVLLGLIAVFAAAVLALLYL